MAWPTVHPDERHQHIRMAQGNGMVLTISVDDVDGAAAVVLDDLVLGVIGATADDPGLRAGL